MGQSRYSHTSKCNIADSLQYTVFMLHLISYNLNLVLTTIGSTFQLTLVCHGGSPLLLYTYVILIFTSVKPFTINFV
jgi:hypothetical protein